MVPFERASFKEQVRRLRKLAEAALERYPIELKSLRFIHHGENTTFRAEDRNGRKFLVRVCRHDYHTSPALMEELKWLEALAEKKFLVPRPLRSRKNKLIEAVSTDGVPHPRNCCVFAWIDGKAIDNPTLKQVRLAGELLGKFQKHRPKSTRHRKYWHADGLAGPHGRFGSIDKLSRVSAKEQKRITHARKVVHAKLKLYEKKFPKRMGMIHADMHFGNVVAAGSKIAAIDFDDCGRGFLIYDLVPPLISSFTRKNVRKNEKIKRALIEGYSRYAPWDEHDEEILPYLMAARRLMMLGWIDLRSDNPRLKKIFRGAITRAFRYLKAEHGL